MNILFISIAWPKTGERNLYTDLIDEFIRRGNKVYVAGTSDSEYNFTNKVTVENGINILRIKAGKIRKTSHFRKALSLLTLDRKMHRAIQKNFRSIRFDLILGPTPPVTFSRLYIKLKKSNRAPFYLLLKDIWPQGSVDLKVIRKYSLSWFWLRAHERRIYKAADFIGCMSPMGIEYLWQKNKYLLKSKLEVCPNCIRPTSRVPDANTAEVRLKYNIPSDACVFIFSGNIGIGHGLGFLVEMIASLRDYTKAYFVIGGSGTQYRFLFERLRDHAAENVFLYEWLPAEDFIQILASSDVGLILLHKYTVPQFPSRLLSYLDFSKPVLCAVNDNTDIGKIVEDSGCGRSVTHGDQNGFIDAVKFFSENKKKRVEMGENGRKLLIENYTVSRGYEIIMNHFSDFNTLNAVQKG